MIKYLINIFRTFLFFNVRYPWVKYNGFVRVMSHTKFAKRKIVLGHHVQFGKYCSVATDLKVGNYVLFASRVCFLAGNDHNIKNPCELMWNSNVNSPKAVIVGNDVWIGNGVNILGGVIIGDGAVVAAGAVVTKSIPPCEVWGGIPAIKLKNRFCTEEDKRKHLKFIESICQN